MFFAKSSDSLPREQMIVLVMTEPWADPHWWPGSQASRSPVSLVQDLLHKEEDIGIFDEMAGGIGLVLAEISLVTV